MKIPNWNTLTVEQYQLVYSVMVSDKEDVDKQVAIIAILSDMPEHEVEALPIETFNKRCKEIAYLFTKEIPGKTSKYIKANGKVFKPQYMVNRFRFAQYVEVLKFCGSFVDDIHKLMASICDRVEFKRTGLLRLKKEEIFIANDSSQHEEVANDLLQARFIDVYHAAVFFYRVLRGSINLMRDSLIKEMSQKMKKETAEKILTTLQSDMDGFIPPIKLPGLRVSV